MTIDIQKVSDASLIKATDEQVKKISVKCTELQEKEQEVLKETTDTLKNKEEDVKEQAAEIKKLEEVSEVNRDKKNYVQKLNIPKYPYRRLE